jgi:hypothetical protein
LFCLNTYVLLIKYAAEKKSALKNWQFLALLELYLSLMMMTVMLIRRWALKQLLKNATEYGSIEMIVRHRDKKAIALII